MPPAEIRPFIRGAGQ